MYYNLDLFQKTIPKLVTVNPLNQKLLLPLYSSPICNSPNSLTSPMASNSSSAAIMSSSSPLPSDSVLDVESNSHPNQTPTPSGPISYDYGRDRAPPPTHHEMLQPSYYPLPPPYYDPAYAAPSGKNPRSCSLCRVIATIILLIFQFTIFTFFLYQICNPEYPSVSITSATVSSFATSSNSSTVSSDFTLTFSIHNHNEKMGVSYSGMSVYVDFGVDTIGSKKQHKFSQDSREETSKEVRVTEMNKDVTASTIKAINDDLASNGLVKFVVDLNALMSYSKILWFPRFLEVTCPDLKIHFVNGTEKGAMVGPAVKCNVFK